VLSLVDPPGQVEEGQQHQRLVGERGQRLTVLGVQDPGQDLHQVAVRATDGVLATTPGTAGRVVGDPWARPWPQQMHRLTSCPWWGQSWPLMRRRRRRAERWAR